MPTQGDLFNLLILNRLWDMQFIFYPELFNVLNKDSKI